MWHFNYCRKLRYTLSQSRNTIKKYGKLVNPVNYISKVLSGFWPTKTWHLPVITHKKAITKDWKFGMIPVSYFLNPTQLQVDKPPSWVTSGELIQTCVWVKDCSKRLKLIFKFETDIHNTDPVKFWERKNFPLNFDICTAFGAHCSFCLLTFWVEVHSRTSLSHHSWNQLFR